MHCSTFIVFVNNWVNDTTVPLLASYQGFCFNYLTVNQSLFKGNILRSEIDGCIQMKNFVAGYPEVKIALNEDFFVGKSDVVSRGMLSNASF